MRLSSENSNPTRTIQRANGMRIRDKGSEHNWSSSERARPEPPTESWTLKAVWRLRDLINEDGPFRGKLSVRPWASQPPDPQCSTTRHYTLTPRQQHTYKSTYRLHENNCACPGGRRGDGVVEFLNN
ncbi:hypothetical protein AAG570_012843 [Ranatra chinensis]|uniref:Uncharacterized protein n=1 Tax=Ranatra chinensis TaxID=642074 RepID=A0ABD0Z398_9HEMI